MLESRRGRGREREGEGGRGREREGEVVCTSRERASGKLYICIIKLVWNGPDKIPNLWLAFLV